MANLVACIMCFYVHHAYIQLYCTPESGNVGLCCCDVSVQGDRVFTGQSNGELVLLDLRMRSTPVKSLHAHERAVKSVHINPVYDHLMLSASSDM